MVCHIKFIYQMYNNQIKSQEECNRIISSKIENNEIFLSSRLGGVESDIIHHHINQIPYSEKIRYMACNNAGINPVDDYTLNKFSELYTSNISDIDILGVWDVSVKTHIPIVNDYAKNSILVDLPSLEPYYNFDSPWSKSLSFKKILVIHPFEETIRKQYKKRELIFNQTEILPDFELVTYKPFQNMGKIDSDFFYSIEKMKDDISKLNFDIALIGCGAFGLPLGSFIKNDMEKTAVHLGGCLQILFGIMGKRWTTNQKIMKFYNENWTYPNKDERPQNFLLVENGCYW
jgi:hypothetical protein